VPNHERDKGKGTSIYRHPAVPIRLIHRRYPAGKSFSVGSARTEQVLTLLSGVLEVSGPVSGVLARRSVFEDPPSAIYVGRGQKVTVLGKKAGELVILECAAQKPGPVRIVRAANQEERGKEGFRRMVYNLIDEQFPAERLLVGETFNQPGNWSSFPPHKHDRVARGERRLQEVYFAARTGFRAHASLRLRGARRNIRGAQQRRGMDPAWISSSFGDARTPSLLSLGAGRGRPQTEVEHRPAVSLVAVTSRKTVESGQFSLPRFSTNFLNHTRDPSEPEPLHGLSSELGLLLH